MPFPSVTDAGPSDQTGLERIRAGDEDAFEQLFREHYPSLLGYARAHLGERADAEDVVHDIFLRLWRERATLECHRSIRAYLLTAVRNRMIDLVRHRSAEAKWRVGSADELSGRSRSPAVSVPCPDSLSDAAALAELDTAIRKAVTALPERCRTAFLLCREQELSYAEAAAVMGVSPATVKTQMARALASLRNALDPYLSVLVVLSSLLR